MMRKYGLDEGSLYVEQCTLLEPNNFIPSWVSHLKYNRFTNRRLVMKKLKKSHLLSKIYERSTMISIRWQLKKNITWSLSWKVCKRFRRKRDKLSEIQEVLRLRPMQQSKTLKTSGLNMRHSDSTKWAISICWNVWSKTWLLFSFNLMTWTNLFTQKQSSTKKNQLNIDWPKKTDCKASTGSTFSWRILIMSSKKDKKELYLYSCRLKTKKRHFRKEWIE